MANRPKWWPAWVPQKCANGHPFVPGKASSSWVHCTCEGAGEARGHHVWHCGVVGCRDETWPVEHTGPKLDQR